MEQITQDALSPLPDAPKVKGGKDFWQSLLRTVLGISISIVLTFGTAAIINHHSKQREKHEIVMMVMYDMYNTLQWVEKNDSLFHEAMLYQKRLAENPAEYDIINTTITMARFIPPVDYTETTERIFSTNIETINTVGNVLFTETVAEFYQTRTSYKENVCDSILNTIKAYPSPFHTLQGAIDYDFSDYAFISNEIKTFMQPLFDQCKQMMDVSDEEIEIYQKERQKIKKEVPVDDEARVKKNQEIIQLLDEIKAAKKKQKIE